MKTMGWYKRAALYGVVGFLVGIVLAAAIGWVSESGYLVRWRRLASPPVQFDALAACDGSFVYARASLDAVYGWSWESESWIQDEIPPYLRQNEYKGAGYHIKMTRPCDDSSRAFSWITNAPPHRTDCIQGTWVNVDYGDEFACVLDADNSVWIWSNGWSVLQDRAFARIRYLGLSGIGGIVGVIFGIKRSRKRSLGKTGDR